MHWTAADVAQMRLGAGKKGRGGACRCRVASEMSKAERACAKIKSSDHVVLATTFLSLSPLYM